jgi:long-chain acyl-CoA synthetase
MLREASGPPMTPLPRDAHLLQPVMTWAREHPERAVMAYREGSRFVDVSWKEAHDRIWQLARGLIASGVEPGDRVALMAHTRLEWPMVDYAILAAGGVTVPIYETSSADQMEWVIGNSGAVLAILESREMRQLYDGIANAVSDCREALVIDAGGLDELARRGDSVDPDAVEQRVASLTADQVATIIYTSGTTGRPKGCVLTHGNLRVNVWQNLDALATMLEGEQRSLLFLPLAHALTKLVMLVGIEHGIKTAFATGMEHLPDELPMARPTTVVAVPRVFEKVFNTAQQKAHAERKGAIFDRATEVAIRYSRQRVGGRVRPTTALAHKLFDRLVYGKIRAAFGGDLRTAVSGGAPLGGRLTLFFDGIGVRIFEGYGLTETSPTLTVNRADAWKPGTVGQPVAATEIRIADDSEVLARGPQVFSGYWRDQASTDEVLESQGWFRTGDIGELDDDGFLRITGRKKDLIITAAGKNIVGAPLEDQLAAHPLISQAVVIGDRRPFISALLALDEEAAGRWADTRGRSDASMEELARDPDLRAELQAAVDDVNRSLSRAESIRKFVVVPRDLSIEAGELTPTLKVRRATVEQTYADEIEALYG